MYLELLVLSRVTRAAVYYCLDFKASPVLPCLCSVSLFPARFASDCSMPFRAGLAEVRRGRKTAARTAADRPPGQYRAGQRV